MHEVKRWPLRPRFQDGLRLGYWGKRSPRGRPEHLKALVAGYEGEVVPGTAGWSHWSSAGLTKRLVQEFVQQGHSDAEAANALFNPANRGGLWLRRQADPEGVLRGMLADVQRHRRPCLPARERYRRILDALKKGTTSQKAIVHAVGHPSEGQVRDDLSAMVALGVVTLESVQHGLVTWKVFTLAVSTKVAWDLTSIERRARARGWALERLRDRVGGWVHLHRQGVHRKAAGFPSGGGRGSRPAGEAVEHQAGPRPCEQRKTARPPGLVSDVEATVLIGQVCSPWPQSQWHEPGSRTPATEQQGVGERR